MSHKASGHLSPRQWICALFRQPPPGFYKMPAVYMSGNVVEIEHFRTILTYNETKLCLQFSHGRFTIYGDGLHILALTSRRITLRGKVLRTDFSDD